MYASDGIPVVAVKDNKLIIICERLLDFLGTAKERLLDNYIDVFGASGTTQSRHLVTAKEAMAVVVVFKYAMDGQGRAVKKGLWYRRVHLRAVTQHLNCWGDAENAAGNS